MKIILSVSFENTSEETEKIFVSEGDFKHRKSHRSEQIISGDNNIKKNTDLNTGPILFSGWVKYFKYRENDINVSNTPKTFVDNKAYAEQMKLFPNANLNEKDNDGKYLFIRDKSIFWVNVFSDSINIISSKQVVLFNIE